MFFNVFIQINEKEQLTTDCFYYNAECHYLNYHSPYQDEDSWCSVSNVECEIKVDRPMIYIYAKTIKDEPEIQKGVVKLSEKSLEILRSKEK